MTSTQTPETDTGVSGDTLLIYAPVPLYMQDGVLHQEDQACNGLRLWAENFDRLMVLSPLAEGPPPPNWVPVTQIGPALERIELLPLPMAYRPDRFLRHLPGAARIIGAAIGRADYLGFAIGGLFGDWGAVASIIAHRRGLPFYVWTDRVESEVTRRAVKTGPWRHRLRARLTHRPMAWLERALIRRATLGLFHGRETFKTYAPFSRNPQLVHDIHIRKQDHIAAQALEAKCARAAAGQAELRILYAGRADAMKGPHDWLDVLERLAARGVAFSAEWLGDGTELAAMRARVDGGPLAGRVALPGFVAARDRVRTAMQEADMLLFCHKTPESPRCLIEALTCGCPILGYDSAFPADLIAGHGGGVLVPPGDRDALADAVAGLARDPAALAGLIGKAARDGAGFDDETVFHHRSALIRQHLPKAR